MADNSSAADAAHAHPRKPGPHGEGSSTGGPGGTADAAEADGAKNGGRPRRRGNRRPADRTRAQTSAVPAPTGELKALLDRLPGLTLRDEGRLGRRLEGLRRVRDEAKRTRLLAEVSAEMDAAEARLATRQESLPKPVYPEALPVSARREEIIAAIRDHQVVIIAGETGSGKTTQLPKMCLELGRGVRGLIGHTQPRRIAARTVAERVAEELGTEVGETVGWKVRFTDQVGDRTAVKVMTDGILLAEIQTDRNLRQYDTIIIDEAHERSLNIDFILGHLKELLPRRPDLKVIITSATIDPERFSKHFALPDGTDETDETEHTGAPIIEVSGRTYPVEVRYRPLVDDADDAGDAPAVDRDRDQVQAICEAVDELFAEGPGDVLVFLSGEREIRDTADALERMKLKGTEILPLYARLSSAEQHRVFQRHSGRRIVLATNVAETSLTVPGIKYVIDPGTARISRYSHRTKVQRLPIEPVSQASANQRKGRCGRTSDGVCIRLYSEEDFLSRPEFTDAEILRTNLASVILQMTAADLGEITTFPFIDPPDRRQIKDGIELLQELGAFDPAARDDKKRLTALGRKLAQLPVDPRLARMVLEADRNGVVREVMVIAAALSIQDPRERPAEKRQAADEKHRRFADETSDFLGYLNLWRHLRKQQRELSSSQFRRTCKAEFLNYLRIREWQDIDAQLRQSAKQLGVTVNPAAEEVDGDAIHRSLLAGLLSHIGLKDPEKNEYFGARQAKFAIFPGSGLASRKQSNKQPRWLIAAELVETSRLWARIAAKVEPDWIEDLAQHLVKRSYSEPHWEKNRGQVVAYEKVMLYGVPLVAQRKVGYGKIDPELSRELFIRNALVEGDWETHHRFFHDNRRLLDDVEELENRARRRDIMVDDETLFDFYDQRIGRDVVSGAHFDAWWKQARRTRPELLTFTADLLVNDNADAVTERDYPSVWHQGELELPLSYQFEPGAEQDGVTVHIPLTVLNQVKPIGFDWQIPGLRQELVTALLRSLPKALRRNFVPAPDYARRLMDRLNAYRPAPDEPPAAITEVLEWELQKLGGAVVPHEAWDWEKVPDHLRITFRVVDGKTGLKLTKVTGSAEDKDLDRLKLRLRSHSQQAIAKAAGGLERSGLTEWTIGELPHTFERKGVKGYPALVDTGGSVAVRLLPTQAEQARAMLTGTRRLLMLSVSSPVNAISGRLGNSAKLALANNPHGSTDALFADCLDAAVDQLIADGGGPAWDEESYGKLRDQVRAELYDATAQVVVRTANILVVAHRVRQRLQSVKKSLMLLPALADLNEQYAELVRPGFVTEAGARRLPDVLRYLKAMERRLVKLAEDPTRDRDRLATVQRVRDAHAELLAALPPDRREDESVVQLRWMIEELRVSLWAQPLGTPYPVSEQRIRRAMDAVA